VNRVLVDKCSFDIVCRSTSVISKVVVGCRGTDRLLIELKQRIATSSL